MSDNNCDFCVNNVYDDEAGCNVCEAELDMDEFERLRAGSFGNCPYFRFSEYETVKKQN